MSYYADSTVFIKGSKKAIVDFLNIGLKNDKLSLRVSTKMKGEQIASLLSELDAENRLDTLSFLPRPKTFEHWDTTNEVLCFWIWVTRGCPTKSHSLEDGESSQDAIALTGNDIYEFMLAHPNDFHLVEAKPLEDPEGVYLSSGGEPNRPHFEWSDYDRAVEMMHPELIAPYRRYIRGYHRAVAYQKKKYGLVGWLNWDQKRGINWAAFDEWKCLKDEEGIMYLASEMESPWSPQITFFEYMNNLEGITVYACGHDEYDLGYMWNGKTLEETKIDPKKDSRYEQMLQEYADEKGVNLNTYEAQYGRSPFFIYEHVSWSIIKEYLDRYKAEIYAELGLEENHG